MSKILKASIPEISVYPRSSMYGIFTYIWLEIMVNVGKYSISTWFTSEFPNIVIYQFNSLGLKIESLRPVVQMVFWILDLHKEYVQQSDIWIPWAFFMIYPP